VHHGRDPKYIDKNHAGSLIIWDRMFGTFQAEEEHPHYGITKPTGTFNPLLAHWVPIKNLADEVKQVHGFNKIKLLFMPPGWFPQENGGRQMPPHVDDRTYQKYNFDIPAAKGKYLLVQFVVLLAYTAFFLFGYAKFSLIEQVAGASLIVISLLILGGLFEQKLLANTFEYIRLSFFAIFGWFSGSQFLFIGGCVWMLLSITAWLLIHQLKMKTIEN
jgi:hypothetical protein